jgi:mannose-1-phosphate guanylyltransferase/mannose-6-phosphate isomerase
MYCVAESALEMKTFIVKRPWGQFEQFTHNKQTTVKIHTINPAGKSSLQSHSLRKEFWHIVSGGGAVQVGEKEYHVKPGDEYTIPAGTKHRWTGGSEGMVLLEISTGDFNEEDIIRYEDEYGRA